jgi:cytochrome c2
MKRALYVCTLACLILAVAACVNRMAPFSPHRTNTEAHRGAKTNQACIECHSLADIGQGHQATDNCLRCHRIVQGD